VKTKRTKNPETQTLEPTDGVTVEPTEKLLRKWLTGLALVVLPVLMLVLCYHTIYYGLLNTETLDFAQLGRNLSQGRGFVTYALRPLALTHGDNPLRQPDLIHGPLYPFFLALSFGALGATEHAVILVSGAFFVFTVWMAYLLGVRMFSRTVGLIAAAGLVFNASLLEYAMSGLHLTLILFLTTCLLYSFYHVACFTRDAGSGKRLPRVHLALAGILTSALYLSDYTFIVLIPVLLLVVLLFVPVRRLEATAWFIIPAAVIAVPWMVRNASVSGNALLALRGYEVWMNTSTYPGYVAFRGLASQMAPSAGLLKGVTKKVLMGITQVIQALPGISGNWLLAFFMPCLLFQFADPAVNRLRRVAVTCFLSVAIFAVILGLRPPLLIGVVPCLLVFSAAFLLHLIQQARLSRSSVVLVGAMLTMTFVFPIGYQSFLIPKPSPAAEAGASRLVTQRSGKNDVVLTDTPQAVAWYADRPAIWVPYADESTASLRERFKPRWLLLTDQVRHVSPYWQVLYDRFSAWTAADQQARKVIEQREKQGLPATGQVPESLTIGGKSARLFQILEGFTTVSVGTKLSPTVVVGQLKGQGGANVGSTRR